MVDSSSNCRRGKPHTPSASPPSDSTPAPQPPPPPPTAADAAPAARQATPPHREKDREDSGRSIRGWTIDSTMLLGVSQESETEISLQNVDTL